MAAEKKSIFRKITEMPVQVIYLAVLLVVIVPLVRPIGIPLLISPMTQAAYDTVESLPAGSAAVFDFSVGPGNYGEFGGSAPAMSIHLFRHGIKVIYVATSYDGPMFVISLVKPVAESIGKKYGEDWVLIGYIAGLDTGISSFLRDTHSLATTDYFGNPIANIPLMKNVKSGNDIRLAIYVGGGGDAHLAWIRQAVTPYGMKYIDMPSGTMAPNAFPFYPKQISGIVNSLRGGAEYEKLIGRQGVATSQIDAISTSHLLAFVLTIICNVAYFGERMRRSR